METATPTPSREWIEKTSDWLDELKVRLPGWANASGLPAPIVDGKALIQDHTATILRVARLLSDEKLQGDGGLFQARSFLSEVKRRAQAHSLEFMAWELLQRWLAAEAPPKEKWVLHAVGLMGGDSCALKLSPMIRTWAKEGQHLRAGLGLHALRTIGTDTALMQLSSIAKKESSPALKRKAQDFIKGIAESRNLSADQLEDRCVPDCELDERGRRVFNFGPRQFEFVLGPDLKPLLRDGAGKLRPNLPKAGAKDDAMLAAVASSDWQVIKKQIKDVAKLQSVRMKNAMIHSRRWPMAEFERFYLKHPLLMHLSRQVLWGGFDAEQQLSPFRVSEDAECLDVNEAAVALNAFETVGILHPAAVPPELIQRWGSLFNDYGIISPFPQLGRRIHRVAPSEQSATKITSYVGKKVAGASLFYPLKNLDWELRNDEWMAKYYPRTNTCAKFSFSGSINMVFLQPDVPVVMGECFFTRIDESNHLPLGEIEGIAYSETIHDLEIVAAKSQ